MIKHHTIIKTNFCVPNLITETKKEGIKIWRIRTNFVVAIIDGYYVGFWNG